MNRINSLVAAVAISLPLFAGAQTSSGSSTPQSVPADQPRTNLEKQQTQQNGAATKYGEPGSASGTQSTAEDSKSTKAKKASKTTKTDETPTTGTPTNTVSPPKTN